METSIGLSPSRTGAMSERLREVRRTFTFACLRNSTWSAIRKAAMRSRQQGQQVLGTTRRSGLDSSTTTARTNRTRTERRSRVCWQRWRNPSIEWAAIYVSNTGRWNSSDLECSAMTTITCSLPDRLRPSLLLLRLSFPAGSLAQIIGSIPG